MNKLIYLNERSFEASVASGRVGNDLFDELVGLLREIDRRSRGLAVVSHLKLTHLAIGSHPIAAWLGRDKDRARRLKSLQNRAPFDGDFEAIKRVSKGDLDYRHDGQEVIGLGLASWHDGLAVSVDRDPWRQPLLLLRQCLVVEEADGDVRSEENEVHCRNASNPQHIENHADWIDAPPEEGPRTPDELWRDRRRWYPNIAFTPAVESGIRKRPGGDPAIPQIAAKLAKLQRVVAQWEPGSGPPDWGIDVTPENAGRHKYCKFDDLDGTTRLFELHARFTPGENRIHFRLDGQERRIIVAYIGQKLGI